MNLLELSWGQLPQRGAYVQGLKAVDTIGNYSKSLLA